MIKLKKNSKTRSLCTAYEPHGKNIPVIKGVQLPMLSSDAVHSQGAKVSKAQ